MKFAWNAKSVLWVFCISWCVSQKTLTKCEKCMVDLRLEHCVHCHYYPIPCHHLFSSFSVCTVCATFKNFDFISGSHMILHQGSVHPRVYQGFLWLSLLRHLSEIPAVPLSSPFLCYTCWSWIFSIDSQNFLQLFTLAIYPFLYSFWASRFEDSIHIVLRQKWYNARDCTHLYNILF